MDNIKRLNNLSSNNLQIGQILKLSEDSKEDTTKGNTYIVKKGDSLWLIANKNNISINDLKNANNLTSDILTIGQVLTIPTKNAENGSNSNLYVVQRGDSLWSIARKYNVSINEIRMINNLNSDVLMIGQTLIIP